METGIEHGDVRVDGVVIGLEPRWIIEVMIGQVAAGARGAVEYPLAGRRLRLHAAIDLTAALTRTHFTVGGIDAWVSPRAGAVLAIGLAGAFF